MNKFIRTSLIMFAVCLVIGGGTLIAGIAMGGTLDDATVQIDGDYPWFMKNGDHGLIRFGDDETSDDDFFEDDFDDDDFEDERSEKDDMKDEQKKDQGITEGELCADAADVEELELVFANCSLEILPSNDETIRLKVEESGSQYITAKLDGRTLKIKDTRKKKTTSKSKNIKMKMYVPDLMVFREVDLDMGAGNIEITRLVSDYITIKGGAGSLQAETLVADKELEAELGVGDFRIEEAILGEVDISCGAGSVKIEQCTLGGDLDVSGGMGDVNIGIIGKETDFNYELECGMGELKIFGKTYASLGKEKEINNGAPYTISLECGIGSVTIHEAK